MSEQRQSPQQQSANARRCYYCGKVRPWDYLKVGWHVADDPYEQVFHMECKEDRTCA